MSCHASYETYGIICDCRNIQFYGKEGQKKVHESLVVVIGLGGVGSHAATMLLRAGVGRLRLVDFDQVCKDPFFFQCSSPSKNILT